MNADEIMRALKSNAEVNHHAAVMMMAADLIETLQAQLAASQRRAQTARNELCLKCGRYHEAHNGACDGCRWKENSDGFEALLERWGNGDSDNAVCATALAALREKAERSKGCRYCNTTQNRYLTDDVYMATANSCGDTQRVLTSNNGMQYKTLGFCPSCGKRLEVEYGN